MLNQADVIFAAPQAAEVREVFIYQAALDATRTLLTERKVGAVQIGRNLRYAKAAGKLKEFCADLGLHEITANGFIMQANIADGTIPAARTIKSVTPRYTLREVRDMLKGELKEKKSLEQVIAEFDDAIASRT